MTMNTLAAWGALGLIGGWLDASWQATGTSGSETTWSVEGRSEVPGALTATNLAAYKIGIRKVTSYKAARMEGATTLQCYKIRKK